MGTHTLTPSPTPERPWGFIEKGAGPEQGIQGLRGCCSCSSSNLCLSFLPQNTPPSPAGSSEGAPLPLRGRGRARAWGARGLSGGCCFPSLCLHRLLWLLFLCGYLLQVALCQTHTQLHAHVHTQLPTGTHTHQWPFRVGRERVTPGVKFVSTSWPPGSQHEVLQELLLSQDCFSPPSCPGDSVCCLSRWVGQGQPAVGAVSPPLWRSRPPPKLAAPSSTDTLALGGCSHCDNGKSGVWGRLSSPGGPACAQAPPPKPATSPLILRPVPELKLWRQPGAPSGQQIPHHPPAIPLPPAPSSGGLQISAE